MKIISGGQNGVDQAALYAAQRCGLETGGFMPEGFMTLDGPRPNFADRFKMREWKSIGSLDQQYAQRTFKNIERSDATIVIAMFFSSNGEQCTSRGLVFHKKRHMSLKVRSLFTEMEVPPKAVADWILDHKIKTLNVAGNSERTCPGIGDYAFKYLVEIFSIIKAG